MPKEQSRAIAWVFTMNNPTTDIESIEHAKIRYAIWQKETGESGTPHYQGYIQFKDKKRFNEARTIIQGIFQGAHLEIARGTLEENQAYCSKLEGRMAGPFNYGTAKTQGKRTDLEEVRGKIKARVPMKQIADEHFGSFVRYHKGFEIYQSMQMPERTEKPEVYIHYGPTRVGKTYLAKTEHPGEHYMKDKTKWWFGYEQQPTVILDEFSGSNMTADELKLLLDENKYNVETKGGQMKFNSKFIYLTSNKHPGDWYPNLGEADRKAIWARIDYYRVWTNRHEFHTVKREEADWNGEKAWEEFTQFTSSIGQ